jgi:hypothetical protein
MNLLLKIFLKLQEHYNYLQITKYIKKFKKSLITAWLGLGLEMIKLSLLN